MTRRQNYRMRTAASGREAIVAAEDGVLYRDRLTGEELYPVSETLPLAPSASSLPRSISNLASCSRCEQLIGRDVSDCPYCGLRQNP